MKNDNIKKIKTNTIKTISTKKRYIKSSKKDYIKIIEILEKNYPNPKCGLNFNKPIELVIALILAAQCTDERVNKIIPILFSKYPDVYDLAQAKQKDISNIIHSCGFYNNKSKNIIETSKILLNNFNGVVPKTMDELCTLKGIGRKSSNIILQECFNVTVGIAVDTHVTRLSRKMGLSNKKTADKIEQELTTKINKRYWPILNQILVLHGRAICIARKPKCDICPINNLCPKND